MVWNFESSFSVEGCFCFSDGEAIAFACWVSLVRPFVE